MTADALRDRIARALYNEGASCGECRSYSGWDSCDECRRHVLGLADEVLAVLADADPTDLGLEQVGWFVRFPSGIEAIRLKTPFTNDSDMGRQQPVYARRRTEETPDA